MTEKLRFFAETPAKKIEKDDDGANAISLFI